jgi:uncharacterized protein involved in exopolysaccharide biosynthesis
MSKAYTNEIQAIKDTLLMCLKNWYYFLVSFIVCAVLAVLYIKTATPVMNVKAKVSLRHNESIVGGAISGGTSMLSAFGLGKGSENIEDESIKLGSQGFLRNVIRELGLHVDYQKTSFFGFSKKELYDRSPITISADPSLADTLRVPLVFKLNVKENATSVKMKLGRKTIGNYEISTFPATLQTTWGEFTFNRSEYYGDYDMPLTLQVLFGSYDYMAQIYNNALLIDFMKKNSDMINLEMQSENVFLAKNLLNHIIDYYNREWDTDKSEVTRRTLDFIDQRLRLVVDSLEQVDFEIKNFKNRYSLTDIEADVKYYFTVSGELQPNIIAARSQLGMIQLAEDYLKDPENRYSPLPLSMSPTNEKLAEIIAVYNSLLQRRNDMFVEGSSPTSMAQSYDNQIDAQRKALLETMSNSKKGLQLTIDELTKKEKEVTRKIDNIPAIEKDYIHLKREQEIQQSIYVFLLEMREETGARGITLLPKLKVIDPPYVVNKPVSPSTMKVALCVLFFGLIVLPFGAIYCEPFVREYFRKKKH